jgi:hypothetical protein
MTDAHKIADQIQKENCFCNCEVVAFRCAKQRNRIKEAIVAAELRGKITGMRVAADLVFRMNALDGRNMSNVYVNGFQDSKFWALEEITRAAYRLEHGLEEQT